MGKKDLPDDVDDILHYTAAMKHGLALLRKLPVSTRLIKEVHRVLLEEGRQNAHAMPENFERHKTGSAEQHFEQLNSFHPRYTKCSRLSVIWKSF
jgi:hypothetical protein